MERKKRIWKKLVKGVLIALLILVILAGGLIGYLSVTEFRPEAVEPVTVEGNADRVFSGTQVRVLAMNTGYAGLGAKSDFFMDGGEQVHPLSEQYVKDNMEAISKLLGEVSADFILLQEVDEKSTRSSCQNQVEYYRTQSGLSSAFAMNYSCDFVPFPLPPIGTVHSGLQTLSTYHISSAERVSLPCPFSWPVSVANLKRCLLVTRIPIEGSEKELVLINLHLEAYDDGEGKIKQTQTMLKVLQEEYARGNYVIAGGDFNQTFPNARITYPIKNPELWMPGTLSEDSLPAGWRYAWDASTPTCRLLNQPLDADKEATQFYIIDGFLLSPNVSLQSVQALDLGFVNTDHNPVLLEVVLQ